MQIKQLPILSAVVLAATANGLALPKNGTGILLGAGDSDPEICKLDPYDPSSWSRGGGDVLVEGWMQESNWDEHDWLRKLDANATGTGGGNSNLDCTNLYNSGTCTAPTQQCKYFTPYNFYYVRQMAANFNQYMTWAHELLQDYTISNNLKIDEMVSDLNVYKFDETAADNLLRTFAALFSFGDKITKQGNGKAGDISGFIGAAVGLVAAQNTPSTPTASDITQAVESVLEQYFTNLRDNLVKINNRMFGGSQLDSGEPDILDAFLEQLKAVTYTGSWRSKVSQVWASGAFLESTSKSQISEAFVAGYEQLTKRLIGNLFTSSETVVLAARMDDPNKYCSGYGNRYINGYCYMLYFGNNDNRLEAVSSDVMEKLEFKYGIDPAALYANVDACNNGYNADGTQINPNGLGLSLDGNGYSPCFFNMALLKAENKDCTKWNSNWPSWFRNGRITGLTCPKGTV